MKSTSFLAALAGTAVMAGTASAGTVTWGGAATTDVDNWTTSSTAFDDTSGNQTGHSFNWENVTTNTATIDSANNEFDITFGANTNNTIGHLFMYNETFDLAGTTGGLETLTMTANFEATSFANWSPVVAITTGTGTTYYRWNHGGNTWNGNGDLDFSLGNFDLSQNGNATNTTTVIWGELNAVAGNFGATRDNDTNPNLQATSGTFQVGFLQWGASTGGNIDPAVDFTTAIDSWETEFTFTDVPEPGSLALLAMGGLLIARRRRA